jgi:hypothetical protein
VVSYVNRFQSWQLRILCSSICLMLIMAFINLGCTSQGQVPNRRDKERSFEATIEIPVEPEVHLLTDKNRYRPDDYIGMRVDNDTGDTLWFTDEWLGMRVFQYDEQGQIWRSVDLDAKLGNPSVVSIEPGLSHPFTTRLIPVRGIRASGNLRLVITGVTDREQMFVAYKDIEIID